ncbi:MAG TPA: 50S ribosomal protein L17 [bacterium]|nr:50S ribosomal protein L17 [bacterium]
MRHQVRKKRFGRHSSHRIAMFRNMVTSLIEAERITTTLAKAKELRRFAEKMVTLAKTGTLHARRQAAAYVRGSSAVQKLFAELGPRFKERQGGYTRILKLGNRLGDGAEMAIIEYLGYQPRVKKAKTETPAAEAKAEKKEKPAKKEKAEKKEKVEKKAKAEKAPKAKKEKAEKPEKKKAEKKKDK